MLKAVARSLFVSCFVVAVLLPEKAFVQQPTPVMLVQDLYSQFKGDCSPEAPDLELLRAMAAPELAYLLDREMACQSQGEICKYDFSVIVDGQDCQLSDLALSLTRKSEKHVTVTALFKNMGQPSEVAYDFSRGTGVWQLMDVRVAGEPAVSLLQLLR